MEHVKQLRDADDPRVDHPLEGAGQAHRPRALRPRRRLLRGVPRRAHGLYFGLFRDESETARAGPGQQDRPGVPQAHDRGRATRCSTSAAAGARSRCTRRRGSARSRPGSRSARIRRRSATRASPKPASRPARIECLDYRDISRQAVRPHLEPRDGRARRREEPREVLQPRLRPPQGRRPLPPAVLRPAPRRPTRACPRSACAPRT